MKEKNEQYTTENIEKSQTASSEIKTQTIDTAGFYFFDDTSYNGISMRPNPCGDASSKIRYANILVVGIHFIILYFKRLLAVLY